jgi:hypothetical protein
MDMMLYKAHETLQGDYEGNEEEKKNIDKINFCSLVFEKVKPNNRGLKMLQMKNIKTPPAKKMKI